MNSTEVMDIITDIFGAKPGSNVDNPLTSNLRVATFSIALFDVIQTIPGEIQLYRKQFKNGRMSLVCFLFIVVRYVSITALVLNGVGYYGTTFTYEDCVKFRLAPPVTKMIAGMACQAIILLRTWAISRKSRGVLIILGVLFVLCLPFLILGNVYRRDPYVEPGTGSCIAKQLGNLNTAPMYYGAMSAFDVVACVIATYYLLDLDAKSTMSGFTRKVLKHGLIYTFGTTLSNIIVLMAVCHVKYIEKLGAFLSVAITMIMAQHLVLATQNFNDSTSANYSSTREPPSLGRPVFPAKAFRSSESGNTRPVSSVIVRGPGGRTGRGNPNDTFELGVRVQTETHMDNGDDNGVRTVDLQRAESRSSTGASGKVQYDPERGYGPYDEDETRKYDSDAKQLR
ncbi:hypothetical protein RSOLAG1IB_02656 [Rhizoctonia solani AG-1 IB]|uniref:Uncharacterized protein n=1 Tax=Thanatephorus cucumeris (strain AG1-IB / isolate 7/3/14) TaxID=1108050 RepID=M5BQG2_THACB|nr:hypothetical protein BN14_03398 [Rhizoctonia solani AG-1 IB]CEL57912.1 hypothetical protein RSOLAG1IB_02656 [Rhizoctonia solani AG-1 IB]